MLKNWRLEACQFLGLVIFTAVAAGIPIYTPGVMQKYFIAELEEMQRNSKDYPGSLTVGVSTDSVSVFERIQKQKERKQDLYADPEIAAFYEMRFENLVTQHAYLKDSVEPLLDIPLLARVELLQTSLYRVVCDTKDIKANAFTRLTSMEGLEEHVRLISGRWPVDQTVDDGVYEVLVGDYLYNDVNLELGRDFVLQDPYAYSSLPPIVIRPVGVFTRKDVSDPFWASGVWVEDLAFINPALFMQDFYTSQRMDAMVQCFVMDYHQMRISDLFRINKATQSVEASLMVTPKEQCMVYVRLPMTRMITQYVQRTTQLYWMMWALFVPLFIMVGVYMAMVSDLILRSESNEIALLASRGAGRGQILAAYLLEALLLGGVAFVSAPSAGYWITRMVGASQSFLSFVQRRALPAEISGEAWLYALGAFVIAAAILMLPAVGASKITIVTHKRRLSRDSDRAFWEKVFLDLILLGIAAYGYYNFLQRRELARVSSVKVTEVSTDPSLFIMPALAIIGLGLLFIRLVPLIIRAVYFLGRRFWGPSVYAVLTTTGRSFRPYHTMMLFLIMTLATGFFSASAARTINANAQERVAYAMGTDVTLKPQWESRQINAETGKAVSQSSRPGQPAEEATSDLGDMPTLVTYYLEPPFELFERLEGVETATRVFKKDNLSLTKTSQYLDKTSLMAVEPYPFYLASTGLRGGLNSEALSQMLNALIQNPSACLVSRSVANSLGLAKGDSLDMSWRGSGKAMFIVAGIFDYFPSWNPMVDPESLDKTEPRLVVANLPYVQDYLGKEPYEIWMGLAPDASVADVFAQASALGVPILEAKELPTQLVKQKNDPFYMAINGALSLGFIFCGIVCFFGFVIYWALSVRNRTLQLGIFRAMGMTPARLISMMALEQVMTSGAAVAAGIVIGMVVSRFFVPFFALTFDAAAQVPPFRVVAQQEDFVRILVIVGITLTAGLLVLAFQLMRIQISQALKLGEDS